MIGEDSTFTPNTASEIDYTSWTLPSCFNKSIYDGVVCYEYIDPAQVHGFVQNRMGVQEVDKTDNDGTKFEWPYKTEHIMMERYEQLYDPTLKAFRVMHDLPAHKYGRVKPRSFLSLAVMVRGTRHGLATDYYVDIDMKCAHPSLLLQKMKDAHMPCAYLESYVNDPASTIAQIMEHHKCTKAKAKTLVLSLMNGGSFNGWVKTNSITVSPKKPIPLIEAISKELTKAMDKVHADNAQLIADVKALNKTKWRSLIEEKRGCMGLFLQTLERGVQEACIEHLVDTYHIPLRDIVPSQDGFMLTKAHYREGIAEVVSTFCKEELRLQLDFVVKPFDEAIEIPRVDMELAQVAESRSFDAVSTEFETQHCNIINRGLYMKECDGEFIAMSRTHIHNAYSHMTFDTLKDKKIVPVNFITKWLTSNPNQRNYEDMGIYPNPARCPKKHLNLWVPFAFYEMGEWAEEDTMECEGVLPHTTSPAVTTILNHIRILCGNDEAVYTYFIQWMAQMVQYPEIKSICPVLISKQGAGKGTLIRLMERMLGQSKVMTSSTPARDVWGDFNGAMSTSFLVNLDELAKKDTVEALGRIKALITEPTLMINNKGINAYPIQSYHRFIATTNKEDPIPTSADDRRNLIIRSSDELIGNKAYFTELYRLISDDNVVRAFGEYLLKVPGMNKFGELPMPRTEYHTELAELTKSPLEDWIVEYIGGEGMKSGVHRVSDMYAHFVNWCNMNRIPYAGSSLKFGVSMRNANIPGVEKGQKLNTGNTWNLDFERILRHFNVETVVYDSDDTEIIS